MSECARRDFGTAILQFSEAIPCNFLKRISTLRRASAAEATATVTRSSPGMEDADGGRALSIAMLLATMVIGTAVRVFHLGEQSLWLDEGITYFSASLPWGVLWSTPPGAHPPFYYSIVKLVTTFGHSEATLRVFSAVIGSATIPVVFLIGRQCGGRACGLAAAAALALSAIHVQFSQEARSYALVTFFLALTVWAALAIMMRDRDDRRDTRHLLYIYGLFAALSVFTHVVTIYFVFGLAVAVIARQIAREPKNLRWRALRLPWEFIAINVAVAGIWLGCILWMASTVKNFSSYEHVGFPVLLGFLCDIAGSRFLSSLGSIPDFAVILACLVGANCLAKRRKVDAFILAATLGFAVPFLVWLTGFVRPILMDRTILPSLLGFVLFIGALAMVPRRRMTNALLVAYFAVASLSVAAYHGYFQKQDWRGVAALLANENADNAAAVVCLSAAYWPLRYYAEAPLDAVFSLVPGTPAKASRISEDKLREALKKSASEGTSVNMLERSHSYAPPWLETVDQDAMLQSFDKIWVIESHCFSHNRDVALDAFRRRLKVAGFTNTERKVFEAPDWFHEIRATAYERQ
jgi:predicted membrane-bound mannosyltransferase